MPDTQNKLYLYEAIELRAEYDARLKTLKDCLPETKQNRGRFAMLREDASMHRPSADFSISEAREQLRGLDVKRRKLNSAMQQANFAHRLDYRGEAITLSEALELRKGFNAQIGELHTQVVNAAYQRVIYKEDRDIVEPPDVAYVESVVQLDQARLAFRELNRLIRAAAFVVVVDFQDER
jgi:hypothetical protein